MRRVATRHWWAQLVRSRWLFPVVVLGLVLTLLAVVESRQPALAAASNGATEAVSVVNGPSHATGNRYSEDPDISADGRYITFTTAAAFAPVSPPGSSPSGKQDIYVRDTVAQTTTYLSRAHSDGDDLESNGSSFSSSVSASGRYVAFASTAPNLVGGAGGTVLVCDRGAATGTGFGEHCEYTNLFGFGAGGGRPDLSADGTRLAMLRSTAARIVDLGHNGDGDITSVAESTPAAPASIAFGSLTLGNRVDTAVALSADGRYLVRVSQFHDTPASPASATYVTAVFVNDLTSSATAQRIDLAPGGGFVGNDNNVLTEVAISGDGNRIAFTEFRYDSDDDVVYAVNRATGTSELASRNVNNTIATGTDPSFSTDGRYLAFATDAPFTHNGVDDTDEVESCNHSEPVISAYEMPLQPTAPASTGADPQQRPARHGQVGGHDLTLVAETGRSNCDVVVRDLVVDAQRAAAGLSRLPAELASPSLLTNCLAFNPAAPSTCEGNNDSSDPVLDADGSAVAYGSIATDLVSTPDTNGERDVFKRTFLPSLTVGAVDFGSVGVDSEATVPVPVTYHGFGPLQVATVTFGGSNAGDFTLSGPNTCVGVLLHEGDTCSVSVRFVPGAVGPRSGTITLTPTRGSSATGELTGIGLPPKVPGFLAVPDPLAFGVQPLFVPSAAKPVTVTNTGSAPLTITAVALTGSFPGDYTITGNTCLAAAIAPAATCQVLLTFAPHTVGDRPAILQFTDNAVPGPQQVVLTGSGAPPTLTANPPLAPPGAVSKITGTGFPPGRQVVITLALMPGQLVVTAAANGTFTVPLVIFPNTDPGKRKLTATVQGVPEPISVAIDFLVVPGSLQPPDFAGRR